MKKNNIIKLSLVSILIFIVVFYYYTTVDTSNIDSIEQAKARTVGERIKVPDFYLTDFEGNKTNLSDYLGKTVVLNFWASWCSDCVEEMPAFNEINKNFEEQGDTVLLSINLTDGQKETKNSATDFLKNNDYSMNIFYDFDDTIASLFGISKIPSTIVIDKEGHLSSYQPKILSKEEIEEMVIGAK
jgi:cytochrome c biogenesis protein CcmG, thiol:disulfide interchange protein DsbE